LQLEENHGFQTGHSGHDLSNRHIEQNALSAKRPGTTYNNLSRISPELPLSNNLRWCWELCSRAIFMLCRHVEGRRPNENTANKKSHRLKTVANQQNASVFPNQVALAARPVSPSSNRRVRSSIICTKKGPLKGRINIEKCWSTQNRNKVSTFKSTVQLRCRTRNIIELIILSALKLLFVGQSQVGRFRSKLAIGKSQSALLCVRRPFGFLPERSSVRLLKSMKIGWKIECSRS